MSLLPPDVLTELDIGRFFFFMFLKIYLFVFLERGKGRENERERNIIDGLRLTHPRLGTWPATWACALTRNRTSDLSVLRLALSPLSPTSQGWDTF